MLTAAIPPPLTVSAALTAWQFAPLVDGTLGALTAAYLAGVWRVRRRHPRGPWPLRWTLAFLAGLAVIAVAVDSSAGVYDGVLFTAHMAQHLLLIMVAPPLLVCGRPVTLAMHAMGNPAHTWVKRAVRSPVVTALTRPWAATLGYVVVVAATHTPPVMGLVLRNQAAHDAEHALYLVSGYLFFLLIAGAEPVRWRVSPLGRYIMLLLAMQVDTVVGVVLMVAGHEIFPAYSATTRHWGPSPLADLHDGGMVMWMGSDIVMIAVAVGLSVSIVRTRPLAARATAAPSVRTEDARLAAYNCYLATLDHPGGKGAAPGTPRRAGSSP